VRHFETVWEFKTAQFCIALEIEPEDMDPADSFQFEDDIEAVRSGAVEWFCAVVSVYYNGARISTDSLGACAYKSVREFYTSHRDPNPLNRNSSIMRTAHGANTCIGHYFPDMVANAIRDARHYLHNIQSIKLRA
jgi:hypothetical protein